MAIQTKGFELSISVTDNGGNISTMSWECNTTNVTTFAEAQAARDALMADLAALTDSVITGNRLTEVQYEDNIVYPSAGVENENKLSMSYLISGTNEIGNLKVPAPKIGAFVAASGPSANVCNVGATIVTDYVANFGTGGDFFVSDGQSLGSLLRGKRVSAKNNNG